MTPKIVRPNLDAIDAYCGEASPGEWIAVDLTDETVSPSELADFNAWHDPPAERMWWLRGINWLDQDDLVEGLFLHEVDAQFIARARTDLPAVSRYARGLEGEVERLRDALTHLARTGCRVVHMSREPGWTCLDSMADARARPEKYGEPLKSRLLMRDRLHMCDGCVAIDALHPDQPSPTCNSLLASGPGVEITCGLDAGHEGEHVPGEGS